MVTVRFTDASSPNPNPVVWNGPEDPRPLVFIVIELSVIFSWS